MRPHVRCIPNQAEAAPSLLSGLLNEARVAATREDILTDPNEANYPAVKYAYDFVMPSYQQMASRFDAADNRLTTLLTLITTLTTGAPVFAKAVRPDISLKSPFFISMMVLGIIAAVTGMFGRYSGRIVLTNPHFLFKNTLHESEWEFKKNAVQFAGEHFNQNSATLRRKGELGVWATVALLLEILCYVGWLAF